MTTPRPDETQVERFDILTAMKKGVPAPSKTVPHPIPYQGSKRLQAPFILDQVTEKPKRLIEPFAGSAALTLAAAWRNLAEQYVFGDALEPLAGLWQEIVDNPSDLAQIYAAVWAEQIGNPREHYLAVRALFNQTREPALLLYLLARCVKNAVRFNPRGEFNQSADHRRTGMHPRRMTEQILGASRLLKGRSSVRHSDYKELLHLAGPRDLVYMDPPYQGVSSGKDSRYFKQLNLDEFIQELDRLNSRNVPFILSFDGSTGERTYGVELPPELKLKRILVHTGRSSQATLSGKTDDTVESLYLSPSVAGHANEMPLHHSIATSKTQVSLPL